MNLHSHPVQPFGFSIDPVLALSSLKTDVGDTPYVRTSTLPCPWGERGYPPPCVKPLAPTRLLKRVTRTAVESGCRGNRRRFGGVCPPCLLGASAVAAPDQLHWAFHPPGLLRVPRDYFRASRCGPQDRLEVTRRFPGHPGCSL